MDNPRRESMPPIIQLQSILSSTSSGKGFSTLATGEMREFLESLVSEAHHNEITTGPVNKRAIAKNGSQIVFIAKEIGS